MEKKTIIEQYDNIKEKHPDALLLFHRYDFYETYLDDAEKTAKILGLTLTKRNEGIVMASFPRQALDAYLPKLLRSGCRIALCDSLEPEKKYKKPSNN